MRIAYIGNRKNLDSDGKSFNTENHIAITLEQLGHEVLFLQEDELTPNWGKSDSLNGVDLVLYTRTWGNFVTLDDLQDLKDRGITTASYHLDLYVGLQRVDGLENDPFWRTDYVFTPDGDPESQKVFESKGINHYYIKPGVFKDECIMLLDEMEHDVVFVGGGVLYGHSEWPYRSQLVTFLKECYKERYTKYGYPEATVRGMDLNKLYGSSKIVIGDSICLPMGEFTHEHYWSDRIYETVGRGGFIIHPYIKGLEEEFTDKENIVFYKYGDFYQLRQLIDYYLEHDEEREAIRLKGFELVRDKCTYHNRLEEALNVIFPTRQVVKESVILEEASKMPDGSIELGVKHMEAIESKITDKTKISLGCGQESEQGEEWLNLDLVDLPEVDVVHNLMEFPYPFEDEQFEYIKAKDIIEHLDNYTKDGKPSILAFVEECYRILKPGGTLWIQAPGWDADFLWIDPTHVRGFDYRSMDFFDPESDFGRATGFYSEAKFKVKSKVLENKNVQFEMRKI